MGVYRSNLNQRIAALPLREMARLLGRSTNAVSVLRDRDELEALRSRFHLYVIGEAAQIDFTGIEDAWRSYLEWLDLTHPARVERLKASVAALEDNEETGRKIEGMALSLSSEIGGRRKEYRLPLKELSEALLRAMADAGMSRDEIKWASASRAKKHGGEQARAHPIHAEPPTRWLAWI